MSKKIIVTFLLVAFISFTFIGSHVLADTGTEQLNTAVENLNNGSDETYKVLSEILGILAWVGFAIATFKIIQIGIMFMTGVSSRRSSAKESLIPWMIGCLICALFGTLGPWFIGMIAAGDNGDIFDTGTTSSHGSPTESEEEESEEGEPEGEESEGEGEGEGEEPEENEEELNLDYGEGEEEEGEGEGEEPEGEEPEDEGEG